MSTDLFDGQLPSMLIPAKIVKEISADDLGLHLVDGKQNRERIVSDSRRFAKVYRKDHRNVIRDIRVIQEKIGSNLSTSFAISWFRKANYFDSYGREQDCYDLTRDGALTLGMSYDPAIAALVLIAFNKMEDALGEQSAVIVQPVLDVIDQAMQQWHARIERTIFDRVNPLAEALEWIQAHLHRRRVELSPQDQRTHCAVIVVYFNGRCPCCQRRQILDSEGKQLLNENNIPISDYDHAKQSASADLQHTWLVCTGDKNSCHYKLTHGSGAIAFRLDRDHAWCNYQRRIIEYSENAKLQGQLL